ncbi:MAG: hypothetical protein ACFE96_13585 [Candidatus Hermodarchaeota archaeon]
MVFENKKTERIYYFTLVYNTVASILILTSFFYIQELTLSISFLILFFSFFFLQKGVGYLIVFLFYSFIESKKSRIIYRVAILYIDWIVSYFSILPLELGMAGLIIFGYDPLPLFLAITGGFLLLFFYYLKRDSDIQFFKPQRSAEED